MPLPARDIGDLNEQPLAGNVLETRLDDTQLHSTTGMHEHLRQTRRTPRPNFSPNAFSEVEDTRPDGKAPALITETVLCGVERECGDVVRVGAVTYETASGMGIEPNHEEESQVMRVPERLETLVADLVVSSCVHENHDEQHEVASNTTSLRIMNV